MTGFFKKSKSRTIKMKSEQLKTQDGIQSHRYVCETGFNEIRYWNESYMTKCITPSFKIKSTGVQLIDHTSKYNLSTQPCHISSNNKQTNTATGEMPFKLYFRSFILKVSVIVDIKINSLKSNVPIILKPIIWFCSAVFHQFSTKVPLLYPLQISRNRRFLVFSGAIEVEHWVKMGS